MRAALAVTRGRASRSYGAGTVTPWEFDDVLCQLPRENQELVGPMA